MPDPDLERRLATLLEAPLSPEELEELAERLRIQELLARMVRSWPLGEEEPWVLPSPEDEA